MDTKKSVLDDDLNSSPTPPVTRSRSEQSGPGKRFFFWITDLNFYNISQVAYIDY